jgi:hypothetical protein
MPFNRPAKKRVVEKKVAAAPVDVKPEKPTRFSKAQLASSYVRSDDGWLMVETTTGCFVGQKPTAKAKSISAANDNAAAQAVAA